MKKDFLTYQAQTSSEPLGLEISRASGSYIFDIHERSYLDFVAGVSACTLGHSHPKVVSAIKQQVDKYMHVMVYGEFILQPALEYTKLLASLLPDPLETTYLVNSGTEAIEGALKLARLYTGRSQIIAAHHGYHGNTMGSLSIMDYEPRKAPFRPLIPDVDFITFNNENDLDKITTKTAAVVLETIQGGAGFIEPKNDFLSKVREQCDKHKVLLILDEIQPGFGRTGKLFAFEHYNCVPDILVIGKGMASGLPVGAFTSSQQIMRTLSHPALGHITTFGGNPVIAAACLATLNELLEKDHIENTLKKEKLIRKLLQHNHIAEIRGRGLMISLILKSAPMASYLIRSCTQRGLILFWLLFEPRAVRITPPLTISETEIEKGCQIILEVLDNIKQ